MIVVVAVLGLLAAACGRDDDTGGSAGGGSGGGSGGGGGGVTTTAAPDDACAGVTLEATDTGVTADTITVQVMADVGSPLAPGLFQGNFDALKGFETFINDNGGIGCRQLKVETWDSKLTPEESKNGQINACATSLAMVGGNSLFNPDVTSMNTCPDAEGNPVGIADVAALANDINEQCAKNAYIIQGLQENCPEDGSLPTGPRDLLVFNGATDYYLTIEPELKGLFLAAGDLPTTLQSATFLIAAQAEAGVDWVGTVKISGRDEQAAYTPRVQIARDGNANYVYDGANDVAMTKMRQEATAQGLDTIKIWACSIACYTDNFKAAGPVVDDTYVWMQFLPFEEQGSNQELDNYLAAVGTPDAFGAQAWMAAVLFQDAVNEIVESDGPNAITRAKLLEVLNGIDSFDANGWMGPKDPKGGFSDCMVIVKSKGVAFERVQPAEEGTLDCKPEYVVTVNLDPAAEATKIQ